MSPSSATIFLLVLISGVTLIVGPPVITGDPHYIGFDGTPYEFTGFSGGYFSMYSDPAHQVNMLFDDFGMEGLTFIKELGIKYGSNGILVAIRSKSFVKQDGLHQANVEVEVNGKIIPVNDDGQAVQTIGDVQINIAHATSGEDIVIVTTPTLKIKAHKMRAVALHLDVALDLVNPPSNVEHVHGSLGQTLRWTAHRGGAKLEGDEADYLVSGLFADDFAFNQFLGQNA